MWTSEANAKNKLDKTCHERRGATIYRNGQVIARHRSNKKAIVFRAHHEARFCTARRDRGHGGGKTRRETKNAVER